MIGLRFLLFGGKDLERKILELASTRIDKALKGALYAEAQAIMLESKRQVPVDTGLLRSTGYVDRNPPSQGRGVRVELGYQTAYALAVHERTELHHEVGKAKYLEDPLRTASSGFSRRIADRVVVDVLKPLRAFGRVVSGGGEG